MNSTSCNYMENKIPVMDLERALDCLGERAKKGLVRYIQTRNPKASDGYIEEDILDNALQNVFGEASVLLKKQILRQ